MIDATLDQAWDAWTTRAGIVSFFAPEANIEPRVGGAFHIHMDPGGAPGMKGADNMRYMALQPKKKRYVSGPYDWTEWLKQLEAWRAEAAKKTAAPK